MTQLVFNVLLLKLYATFILLGSGVLWFVFVRDIAKTKPSAWAFLLAILAGLVIALFFIDGWQPLK